jgi:predicted Rossmann fold flavoprotein
MAVVVCWETNLIKFHRSLPKVKRVPRKLIVIGGGAAGFFCAVNAAAMDPSLRVTLLEKSGKILSKVKVSGGGRCNITHACFDINEMASQYPRGSNFVRKSFHQFFTADTIQWFEQRDVPLKTEDDGRMFPTTDSSQTIIDCLVGEAKKFGVEIILHAEVSGIKKEETGFLLQVQIAGRPSHEAKHTMADYVCIATGGYPKSSMFGWLIHLGHSIDDHVPSLFTFNMPANRITKLMGISVHSARVRVQGSSLEEQGPLLITHWGMSGPVILRLSAWGANDLYERNYAFPIQVNWLPTYNEQSLREKFRQIRLELAAQKVVNKNPFGLPQRLWEYFMEEAGLESNIRWADLPAKNQNKIIKILCSGEFNVSGKTTFKEEFVTAGGIRTNEVNPQTMMSKKIESLFFAGEVLAVDGITGGFNFQHAWTSGYNAAKAIAGKGNLLSKE